VKKSLLYGRTPERSITAWTPSSTEKKAIKTQVNNVWAPSSTTKKSKTRVYSNLGTIYNKDI
jgi:hypothetical protein